jgi:hypothetical protein
MMAQDFVDQLSGDAGRLCPLDGIGRCLYRSFRRQQQQPACQPDQRK